MSTIAGEKNAVVAPIPDARPADVPPATVRPADAPSADVRPVTLYMIWGDATALCELLRVTHMDEAEFMASPMSRSAVCATLGPLIARAASLGEGGRQTIPGVDWERLMSPGDLSDPRTPYAMDEGLARRTWLAASTQAEPLRRAIANDPRVVRERARVAGVMSRAADEWPQPGRNNAAGEAAARDPQATRLAQAFARFADEVDATVGADALPIRRAWLMMGEPSPVLVLEDEPGMDDAWAMRLARALGEACGSKVSLVPQAQVHPAIWDDVTAREALLWERADAPHERCVPLAAREAGHHGDACCGGHGHGHDHAHGHGHDCGCNGHGHNHG